MALNVYDLAGLLYAYTADAEGNTAQVEDPLGEGANPLELQWIAYAITGALQEMQRLAPAQFERRCGIRLSAPVSGTITVAANKRTVMLGTLVPPEESSGSTVRVGSDTDDNVLYTAGLGYELQTPASTAGEQGCTLYHDCWPAANGVSYERITGDVRVGSYPIAIAADRNELHRVRYGWEDYGNYPGSGTTYPRRALLGNIRAVWCETYANGTDKRTTSRLRFAPMPTTSCVVEADLLPAAQKVTTADILGEPDVELLCPASLHESILMPFALQRYTASPWFRTASAKEEIKRQFEEAKAALLSMRGFLEQQGKMIVIGH